MHFSEILTPTLFVYELIGFEHQIGKNRVVCDLWWFYSFSVGMKRWGNIIISEAAFSGWVRVLVSLHWNFRTKKKTIICTSQLAVINDTILSPSHSVGKYTKMSRQKHPGNKGRSILVQKMPKISTRFRLSATQTKIGIYNFLLKISSKWKEFW